MINFRRVMSLIFILFELCSCAMRPTDLEDALNKAGENRLELDKVLLHYKKDSLKYKAACFLIENMPYHSFLYGSELKKYFKYYECTSGKPHKITETKDSLLKADGTFYFTMLRRKSDICFINSNYLIDNIDWAFRVWEEQPWGKNVSFKQFCEYVLPYRVGDEVPAYWREHLYNLYNPILNNIRNLPEADDPLFVARVLLDSLIKKPVTFTSRLPSGPHIGPNVVDWRSGTCRELADIVTYVLRAVGIPCTMDYMTRGDNNAEHDWNVVIAKDQSEYMIEFPSVLFRPVEKYKSPKGKVYRRTFSLNRKDLDKMDTPPFYIYPIFRNPLFIDVTSHYAAQWNRSLVLSTNILYDKYPSKSIVYLCTSRRQEWLPIAWTLLGKDSLCFSNVEGGIICSLATWDGSKLKLCSNPFLLEKETDAIRYFNPAEQFDTVSIFYKCPLYNEMYTFRMLGGVFEGSNNKSFKIRDTLFLVDQAPERLYSNIYLDQKNKKYRYVRYKGGEKSYCDIAEIEFYEYVDSLNFLTGKIIGTPGCWQGDASHEYTKAFDGDPYSSFDYMYPSSGWTGLDLGSSRSIRKIRYVPRNRDNFIRKGDSYELFYWRDKKWNSVGIKQAKADSLLFIVPKNSLLYLKNHTRGKDERIFEYLNKKQKFW